MNSKTAVRMAVEAAPRPVPPASPQLAERDHELRAALFAIEVTATGLSRGRDQMASRQVDELMDGLVAEIRRVRALIDGHRASPTTFDLGDALAAVLACAGASGLDVRSSVPTGIEVGGRPDSTAQVVLALLDNVRQHAPGSPVELRVAVDGAVVELMVEDRGPGIDPSLSPIVFERGIRGAAGAGSGLGLHIARRVMREQGGDIVVRARCGGGTTFVLQFRSGAAR